MIGRAIGTGLVAHDVAPPGLTERIHRDLHVALAFLIIWQLAVLAGAPRSVTVPLGLLGFVFHVVFAKAYTLVPSYFARELAVPRAPSIQLPLTTFGTVGLASTAVGWLPSWVGTTAALAWLAGVATVSAWATARVSSVSTAMTISYVAAGVVGGDDIGSWDSQQLGTPAA